MSHVHFQIVLQSVCGVNGAFSSEDSKQIKANNICELSSSFRCFLPGEWQRINISLQKSALYAVNSNPSRCALNTERTPFLPCTTVSYFYVIDSASRDCSMKSQQQQKKMQLILASCTCLHIISNSINRGCESNSR